MAAQLLELINPFLTSGIATFVLLYYFVKPEHHKLRTEQIILFWFLVSAVFFFVPYIPRNISIPFAYFILQAGVVYLLLRNYWKIKDRDSLRLTAIFVVLNTLLILVLGYLFKGVV